MTLRRSLSAVTGLLLGVVVSAVLLLPGRVGLDGTTPFVQLAALTPVLLVVVVAVMVVGLVLRSVARRLRRRGSTPGDQRPRRFLAVSAAVVGAVLVVLTAIGFVGSRLLAAELPLAEPGTPELSVLSLNVAHGQADVGAVAALVRAERPDLVVLPEAGDVFRVRLLAELPDYRGSSAVTTSRDDGDTTTLLTGPGVPEPRVTTIPGALFAQVDARFPNGLRVVAAHTAAPVPGQVEPWQADMAAVRSWCATGIPTIVAGDLNGTADMSAFRSATAGCQDALPTLGAGTVATWPTSLPRWFGLQLDHVLAGGGLVVTSVEVLDAAGTDHRAVLARLVAPDAGG